MTQKVKFSNINDPRTFDPDAPLENVITCATGGDAQKATAILNAALSECDRLREAKAATNEEARQLAKRNAELVAAAELALALIKNTWIEDHGNPEVGDAWGALANALNKAKDQSC